MGLLVLNSNGWADPPSNPLWAFVMQCWALCVGYSQIPAFYWTGGHAMVGTSLDQKAISVVFLRGCTAELAVKRSLVGECYMNTYLTRGVTSWVMTIPLGFHLLLWSFTFTHINIYMAFTIIIELI